MPRKCKNSAETLMLDEPGQNQLSVECLLSEALFVKVRAWSVRGIFSMGAGRGSHALSVVGSLGPVQVRTTARAVSCACDHTSIPAQ